MILHNMYQLMLKNVGFGMCLLDVAFGVRFGVGLARADGARVVVDVGLDGLVRAVLIIIFFICI